MDANENLDKLVKSLQDLFCNENHTEKKYEEVWLSDVDFDGLYHSDKFVLNVKALHQIDDCFEEIEYLTKQIFEKIDIKFRSLIWRIVVYNANEEVHCSTDEDEIEVYSLEENECK